MGTLSIWHWLIVLLVVSMIFGTKKLRNIGSDLGGAVRDFREGIRTEEQAELQIGEGAPAHSHGINPDKTADPSD